MRTSEQLKNDVERELRWEPSISAEQIGVSVKDGVVELDGHVGSLYEKWGAERAALRVANVKSVASEISVDIPPGVARTDEDIALAASNQLSWNSLVPDSIKVTVSEGWVTLQGTAAWQYERAEAEKIVRPLVGVKGLSNDILLVPNVSSSGIKTRIEDALKRDAQLGAGGITVEAEGGIVTLRGTVGSWREHEDAENAAFGAPGVSTVSNLIEIRA